MILNLSEFNDKRLYAGVAGCGLRVAGYELRVAGCGLRVTSYELLVADNWSLITDY